MNFRDITKTDFLMSLALAMLMACSSWGVTFSHTCKGDDCIKMIAPVGAAIIVFLVLCLTILFDIFMRWRTKRPFARRAGGWFLASLLAAALPLLRLL